MEERNPYKKKAEKEEKDESEYTTLQQPCLV